MATEDRNTWHDGTKALQEPADAWLDTIDPMREFIRKLEEIDRLAKWELLTPEEVKKIKASLGEVSDETDRCMEEFYSNAQRTRGDGLYDMMQGNFDSIGQGFKAMLQRMAADAIAADIMRGLFGGAGGGTGLLGSFMGLFKNADGVYKSPNLSAYSGGVYDSPRLFAFAKGAGVFAEDGAEAIMPLRRGKDGKLGVQASGGGSVVVNQTVHIDSRSDAASIRADLEQSRLRTEASILDSMCRGGVFARG